MRKITGAAGVLRPGQPLRPELPCPDLLSYSSVSRAEKGLSSRPALALGRPRA